MGISSLFSGVRPAVVGFLAAAAAYMFAGPLLFGALGVEASAYLELTQPMYVFLTIASVIVFPAVLGRLVRVYAAANDMKACRTVFADGLLALVIPGTVLGVLVALLGEAFSGLAGVVGGGDAYVGLAPLFLIGLASAAFRGYFIGVGSYWVYGLSVFVPTVVKLVIAPLLAKIGTVPSAMAQWANLGFVIGEAVALAMLIVLFAIAKPGAGAKHATKKVPQLAEIALKLWTSGALSVLAVFSIWALKRADALVIPSKLSALGLTGSDRLGAFAALTSSAYGIVYFCAGISAALSLLGLRNVRYDFARKDYARVAEHAKSAVKASVLTGLFLAVAVGVLSSPLNAVLYGSVYTANTLQTAMSLTLFMCPAVVFGSLALTFTGLLVACGKSAIAVINCAGAFVLKLIAVLLLPGTAGAAFSTSLLTFALCAVNGVQLFKRSGARLDVLNNVLKPAIAAACSGASMYFLYFGLFKTIPAAVAVPLAMLLGAFVFVAVVLLSKTLDQSDFERMPFGASLYSALCHAGLYK